MWRTSPERGSLGPRDAGETAPRVARFEALVLPHIQAAYNLARFLSRDAEASEDIVQESLLRAFRSIDAFRGVDARPWLLAIVRNCVHTWAQARRSCPVTVPLDTCSPAMNGSPLDGVVGGESSIPASQLWDPDSETPETALLRTSEVAAIRSTIENLPEPFREVLVLRELEELSYREIAVVTAAPMGTVMSRIARARDLFASAWRERFGETRGTLLARSTGEP